MIGHIAVIGGTLFVALVAMGVVMSLVCEIIDRRAAKWRRLKGL